MGLKTTTTRVIQGLMLSIKPMVPRMVTLLVNTWVKPRSCLLYTSSGKEMIPFATSGGSGIGKAEKSLKDHCPAAVWKKGQLLNGAGAADWIKSIL